MVPAGRLRPESGVAPRSPCMSWSLQSRKCPCGDQTGGWTMSKPLGRLRRRHRIMWCDDSRGGASRLNPPIAPEKLAQVCFGQLEGTPADAFVATVGLTAGHTLSYPTKVKGMEFLVDRLESGAKIGESCFWRAAENLRHLWSQGLDPFEIEIREAKRLGIDYWLQLRMDDWHHTDAEGTTYRLTGSRFHEREEKRVLAGSQVLHAVWVSSRLVVPDPDPDLEGGT